MERYILTPVSREFLSAALAGILCRADAPSRNNTRRTRANEPGGMPAEEKCL